MKKIIAAVTLVLASLAMGACSPEGAIAVHFPSEIGKATAIAQCESGMDPNAVSSTNDHGLFQINATTWNKPGHPDPVADYIGRHWHLRYDAYHNAHFAKLIRQKYGWDMWACN